MFIPLVILFTLSGGFIMGYVAHTFTGRFTRNSGIIRVIQQEDKLVYSLELEDDPMVLKEMKEVVFRVETSDKSSNRT